jgi:hypothetical protein
MVVLVREHECYFGSRRLQVDHRLVSFSRLPEQYPGYRVQQRSFTRPVLARYARQVEAVEIDFNRLPIGKETGYF